MKKKNIFGNSLSLYIMIIVMFVIIAAIVIFNAVFQAEEDWKTIGADLMTSLLSAVTVGLIAGTFTKIISDNILKIEKNDRLLKSFGIDKIGGGRSTPKDTLELFGNHLKKVYPKEVKLLFITGNGFFSFFKKDIIHYLSAPDTVLKILLVDYSEENTAYLNRMEEICPQKCSYRQQILEQSLPALKEILAVAQCDPDRIQLRFFKDEYRYNFRIAKYTDGNVIDTKCWWNVQPFNKDAVDLSIMLHGSYLSEEACDQNVIFALDKGFDDLFDQYKNTEYDFSK